jgi:putative ubiquitin-RnfH superfamily antitoxin RatB of RatAB toxin-antitoxin module
MKFSVAHAQGDKGHWLHVDQPEPISLREAIAGSPLMGLYPELDLNSCKFGIFGKIYPSDTLVKEGDRVEIYLPIQCKNEVNKG